MKTTVAVQWMETLVSVAQYWEQEFTKIRFKLYQSYSSKVNAIHWTDMTFVLRKTPVE